MSETNRPKASLAGFTMRIFSSLYDLIVVFAITFIFVGLPISGIEYAIGSTPEKWVQNLLFFTVVYAYYVGFWHKGSGATTGMRTWRLQVADIDTGDKPSLIAATSRFLGLGITILAVGFTFFYLKTGNTQSYEFALSSTIPMLSLICVMLTPNRQTLHDLISRTSVYRVSK
ncbi:MAG: RDD family protein [Ghiorsea sp.]